MHVWTDLSRLISSSRISNSPLVELVALLDGLATLTHLLGMLVEPALDRLQDVFMLGERDLLVGRGQHPFLDRREALHLTFEFREFLLQTRRLPRERLEGSCRSAVSSWLR